MSLPSYTGPLGRTWFYSVRGFGLFVLLFLILPVLVVIPLSFNVEPYFSFTSSMLELDPAAFSSRWYHELNPFNGIAFEVMDFPAKFERIRLQSLTRRTRCWCHYRQDERPASEL